ncbi:MAG: MBL fold metallo-hydrolase, partial [Pseudomonadales bacterium]|nr:MBL fold metallo-hydrolase [Pseudomonadales bacterium]
VDKPIKQVIATHMHPDHVGNAGWLCERFQCDLLMSEAEYFSARCYSTITELGWQSEQFYRKVGLGDDYIEYIQNRVGFAAVVSAVPSAYQRLEHGQILILGGVEWRVIIGRGHTFAHVSLYCEQCDILLAGDQLLPKISPNVSVMATEPKASPLHDWFDSLQALHDLPANTWVLPAHNKPFYGVHERVDALIAHHEEQLQKLLEACIEPQRPIDLLTLLFGREMGFSDMGLAVGECKAHLHMLLDRDLMQRSIIQGVEFYQSSSDSVASRELGDGTI